MKESHNALLFQYKIDLFLLKRFSSLHVKSVDKDWLQKETPYSSADTPNPHPLWSWQALSSLFGFAYTFHIGEITGVLFNWPHLFLRFFQVVIFISTSLLFMRNNILWMDNYILSIHQLMDIWVASTSWLLWVILYICIQVSEWTCFHFSWTYI